MENKQVQEFWKAEFGKYVDVKKARLLEIGCGNGRLGPILTPTVVKGYCGIDPEKRLIAQARKNANSAIKYELGRAEQIPFEEKFDIIFYTFSWHFVNDFDIALKETKRVLKKGGIVAILEPSDKVKVWGSAKFIKRDPDFSQREYDQKMKEIKRAEKALYEQHLFDIVEENKATEDTPVSLWILKAHLFK
ncbi:MAG: class I SAM-dependent methyltransferase [Nanoarchaeota archaeon]